MKQTAVEFLVDNLNYYYSPKWNDILNQAKEMEKQQIIDTYDNAYIDRYYYNSRNGKKYYIEQFKNK